MTLTWKQKVKVWFKKFIRTLLRRYKREIKKAISDYLDARVQDLSTSISTEVGKKIKNDVLTRLINEQVDIYTSSGNEALKSMIDEYIDKLAQGE